MCGFYHAALATKPASAARERAEYGGNRNRHRIIRIRRSSLSNLSSTQTPPVGDELETLVEEASRVQARIKTAKGDIVFTFYPIDARQHCAAFMKLARAGFYDGTTFHRVEPKFVIQGGDPDGNGTGGPGYNLKAEFNSRPHIRGTVAMARSTNPNSAGSQFYICLGDARFLDNQYTVFGQTTVGLDVVDAIRVGDKMETVTIEPIASPA